MRIIYVRSHYAIANYVCTVHACTLLYTVHKLISLLYSFPDTSGVFTDCGVTDPGMCTTTLYNVSKLVYILYILYYTNVMSTRYRKTYVYIIYYSDCATIGT